MHFKAIFMSFFATACTTQNVECQPGTYTCSQSDLGVAILVCDISKVWEIAARCGTHQLCEDGNGAAYCY